VAAASRIYKCSATVHGVTRRPLSLPFWIGSGSCRCCKLRASCCRCGTRTHCRCTAAAQRLYLWPLGPFRGHINHRWPGNQWPSSCGAILHIPTAPVLQCTFVAERGACKPASVHISST
jgi:hypothetical protein